MEEMNGKTISAHDFLKALRISKEEMGKPATTHVVLTGEQVVIREEKKPLLEQTKTLPPVKSIRKADIQKEKDLKRKTEEKQGALW